MVDELVNRQTIRLDAPYFQSSIEPLPEKYRLTLQNAVKSAKVVQLPSPAVAKKKLSNWAIKWDMTFNTDKSHTILFSCSRRPSIPSYNLSGKTLTAVDTVKYLGVHLNHDLSWAAHANHLAARASRVLG